MTTSVDVLKVMDETSDDLRAEDYIYLAIPLEEARAAVAELIEATQRLHDRAEFESFGRDASAEVEAVGAALARVKGA